MDAGTCCVHRCRRRSHDHLGRTIPSGLTFHCFPGWRRNEGGAISELTSRRRAAWVAAVGRSDVTFHRVPASARVCSRHFHSGKPACETLQWDPDWVPSLHMGHADGSTRGTELPPSRARSKTNKKLRQEAALETTRKESGAAGGTAKSAVPPWSEVKCLLQSVLQGRTYIREKPEEETHDQPGTNADISFRDFFHNSLEASLEASSCSRAQLQKPTSVPGDFQVELNFKVPPSSLSSSSCLNCVQLQRRIKELEKRLFGVTLKQEDMKTTTVFSKSPVSPKQVPLPPESVQADEEGAAWLEPLSPSQLLQHAGVQDVDVAEESPPSGTAVLGSSKCRFRKSRSFNPAWLKRFWFLRYSQSLDQMWCHVCRIHADRSHQNLALIKGSSKFKVDNIRRHSGRKYHKVNVERYILQSWPTAAL